MLGVEVISIDDQEDDDLEVVYVQKSAPSKVSLLKLEIELLQALCKSGESIPLEYSKFHTCAKKVNKKFSDAIILSAWKRAIWKQVSNTLLKNKSNLPSTSKSSEPAPIVDLTDPGSPSRSTLPEFPPTNQTGTFEQDALSELDPLSECDSLSESVPLPEPPNQEIVPVALFANSLFEGARPDVSTDIISVNANVNFSSNDLGNFETKQTVQHSDKEEESSSCFPPLSSCNQISTNLNTEDDLQTNKSVQPSDEVQETSSWNLSLLSPCNNMSTNQNTKEEIEETNQEFLEKESNSCNDILCDALNVYLFNDSYDSNNSESSGSSTKQQKQKRKELEEAWTSAAVNDNSDDDSKSSENSFSSAKRRKQEKEQTLTMSNTNDNKTRSVNKSFIGVQAKIEKAKYTSRSKSKKSVNCRKSKSMSEDEFKLFREQQKIIKLRESHKLVEKQLEIVHNRLVDVLIPKYHHNIVADNM